MERSSAEDEGSPKDETSPDVSPILESAREYYDEITEYIKQVDEILDFIKPFPRDTCPVPRSTAARSSTETPDHLENLVRLVEQLKDLKDKDSRLSDGAQYLRDLKKLRERKKLLKYEAESGSNPAVCWTDGRRGEDENQSKKSKSSLPFRKNIRGRSKSVNMDEIVKERFRDEDRRRKMSAGSQKTEKSKVSKWTKVKEAFRWEKAAIDGKFMRRDDGQYLQVPLDKTPESLSDSPVSGQLSGSSSVGASSTICLAVSSGYSGEHSSEGHSTSSGCGADAPPQPPFSSEDDFLSLPIIQNLSSSSSSEKLDELLTYSKLLSKGKDGGESMADPFDDAFRRRTDEAESRRRKSLDSDTALSPSPLQHLSKESLNFSKSKSHKTAWGKVKDIIQTRKDSLKKKPKKRDIGQDQDRDDEPSSPEDKFKEGGTKIEMIVELSDDAAEEPSPNKSSPLESFAKKRLTPMLTITLPSTEELRSISSAETEPKTKTPYGEGRVIAEESLEDIPKYEKSKSGSYHRFSKWSKVKKAFLTSPSRSSEYFREASSMPSSPNKQMSFFSDVESDEMSSGEWTEDKVQAEGDFPATASQEDARRRCLASQRKLSHDFDQKLREWERMKEEAKTKSLLLRQKSEDWEKLPRAARQRESMAIPLPKLDDLSPEFKKKLDEWKKIKKSQSISAVPAALPKDETQNQNFKMRIGEWQRWRPRSGPKMNKAEQNEDFAKKLEEWQRIKEAGRRSRSQSDRGKDEGGNRTPSPRLRRKNSKGTLKKTCGSGKSSGTESLSGSLKEKNGRSGGRKQQKEKDLQWLEKELHKIERGKMRLEREKEKFLEREARLEKMKRTMGTTSPTQEVLIKTSTGFFRFEGISQKFTKRLYEWEKARGIAPEASTFALLEEYARRTTDDGRSNGMSLQRSKSVGSVLEMSSTIQDLAHHPSSLSLNDVDNLDVLDVTGDISRGSSEPTVAGLDQDDEEPQAIIVDVEDVVEETAALMADIPAIKSEVPVYNYASREVTKLVDASNAEANLRLATRTDSAEDTRDSAAIGAEVKSPIRRKYDSDPEGNGTQQRQRDEFDAPSQHSVQQPLDPATTQQEAVSRVHELSSQLLSLAEKLEVALSERSDDRKGSLYNRRKQGSRTRVADEDPTDIMSDASPESRELEALPSMITNKVLELKCGLNVLKNSSDSPIAEMPCASFPVAEVPQQPDQNRSPLRARKSTNLDAAKSLEGSKFISSFSEEASDSERHTNHSPEVIKRKIRETSIMQRMSTEARSRNFKSYEENTDEESAEGGHQDVEKNVVIVKKNEKGNKQRKLLKTRRITDTAIAYKQIVQENRATAAVKEESDDPFNEHCKVLTEHTLADNKTTPVNVFVPTSRKIISPVRRDSKGTTSSVLSYVIDDIFPGEEKKRETEATICRKQEAPQKKNNEIPPLPISPSTPRKLASPGISLMIAKYNKKIEQEANREGGAASPSWRSPFLDRKLQETSKLFKVEVTKSASAGLLNTNDRKGQESSKGILKSSSADVMKSEPQPLEVEIPTASTLRALRIKKAKEEFLSRGPGCHSWTGDLSTAKTTDGNRISHLSIGSESSYDEAFDATLIKSASAGTIDVESRPEEGQKVAAKASSKFGISNIKFAFRKVRMKRREGKEGAVSTLCRQSLRLEMPNGSDSTGECTSKSCPSSPVLERSQSKSENSSSWIRSSRKMFRGKDQRSEAS